VTARRRPRPGPAVRLGRTSRDRGPHPVRLTPRKAPPGRATAAAAVLLTAGCGRLDELPYDPPTTPEQWCDLRPCVDVGGTIVNEPFGTGLVLALTLLWVAAGVWFLATRRGQRSRTWLGIALVLGGLGAGQAGISYQAFSYELKCAGRDLCRLTTGWEVGYSITQALSVSAMLAAVAFASAAGRTRLALLVLATASALGYVLVAAAGVLLPSAALLSFPVLMLFAVPVLLAVILVAARGYRRTRDPMNRSLLVAAALQVAVQVAYFATWTSGMTAALWDDGNGFYFSENEVLHLGMILWLWYVVAVVGKYLHDAPAGAATDAG
jgi:hypothetical protein